MVKSLDTEPYVQRPQPTATRDIILRDIRLRDSGEIFELRVRFLYTVVFSTGALSMRLYRRIIGWVRQRFGKSSDFAHLTKISNSSLEFWHFSHHIIAQITIADDMREGDGDGDGDEDILEEFSLTQTSGMKQREQPTMVDAGRELSALSAPAPSMYAPLCQHGCQMKKKKKNNNSSHLPTCQDDDQQTFFDGPENHFLVAKSTFQLTPGLGHPDDDPEEPSSRSFSPTWVYFSVDRLRKERTYVELEVQAVGAAASPLTRAFRRVRNCYPLLNLTAPYPRRRWTGELSRGYGRPSVLNLFLKHSGVDSTGLRTRGFSGHSLHVTHYKRRYSTILEDDDRMCDGSAWTGMET
ncbi:hypothetical protein BDR07DRAFT_1458067 [Suillus spraguei]|nr:hypothetical protein BDR07DRAFT_1458067 [Suillus spraguei]